MNAIPAATLAPQVNGFTLRAGPPKAIAVPKASTLAALQIISVSGRLLKKQEIAIDPRTGTRKVSLGANGGAYGIEVDGDLHFCLGVKELQPHLTCEVQHATRWLSTFQASIGQPIVASGFFRCLFEHPGFRPGDDAHIFEIHPVNTVTLGGSSPNFDVGLPDPASIHTWSSPHPLNVQDGRIRVTYDRARDTLTFTDMDGEDENYVRVGGTVSAVRAGPRAGGLPSCTLTSAEIGHPIRVLALPGTRAAQQLASLTGPVVTLVGVRNIDLPQALAGKYVINLLAIDIRPGP